MYAVVQLWRARRGQDAEEAAAGVPHEVDLVVPESVAKVMGDRERIGHDLVHRHRLRVDVGAVREPRAALVPPDHGEVVLQAGRVAFGEEELGQARPTVQEQEHRVRGVPTHDEHPLPHAVDVDEHLLRQAAAHGSSRRIDDACRLRPAPQQEEDHHGEGHDERSADEGQHDPSHLPGTRRSDEAAPRCRRHTAASAAVTMRMRSRAASSVRSVAKGDEAVIERSLVDESQVESHAGREEALPAADDDR
jgi:hypothetical protein